MTGAKWIVLILALVIGVGVAIVKFRESWPEGSSPSASAPTRAEQATPEATVNTMFDMYKREFSDTFIGVALIHGKDMKPEEQRFAGLFWDHNRAAVIYNALYELEPEPRSVDPGDVTGDTAQVTVPVKVLPSPNADEKQDLVYYFELMKKSENWYVYELRKEKSGEGLYEKSKKIIEQAP